MSQENLSPSTEDQAGAESMPKLIRSAIFLVSLHLVFFGGLLIQGCKKGTDSASPELESDPIAEEDALPTVDPNYYTQYETNLLNPMVDFPPLEDEEEGNAPTNTLPPPIERFETQPLNNPSAPRITTPHTVEKGETFYGIAKKYNVSLKAVLNANPDINPKTLRPGITVEIPPQEPPALEAETVLDDGSTYTVRKGDSLYKIASMHQVSVQALMTENNLSSSMIHPDQKLRIPKLSNSKP